MANLDLFDPENAARNLAKICDSPMPVGSEDEPEKSITAEELIREVKKYNLLVSIDIGRQRALLIRAGYKEIEGVSIELAPNEKVRGCLKGLLYLAEVGQWNY